MMNTGTVPTFADGDWLDYDYDDFIYDEEGRLIAEYRKYGLALTLARLYVWLDDRPVAVRAADDYPGEWLHIHTDHLGTPRAITRPQQSNATIWRWRLTDTAFGEHAPEQDPDGDSSVFVFDLRYPGQYFDQESGLHYNYFRDGYEAGTGRYTQSDPIGLDAGISTFAYVSSRPLNGSDPKGLAEEGPWHPPEGNAPGCKGTDSCPTLREKMAILTLMLNSHVAWDQENGPRHTQEIQDLRNALAKCQKFYMRQRCDEQNICTETKLGGAACAAAGATVVVVVGSRIIAAAAGACAAVLVMEGS